MATAIVTIGRSTLPCTHCHKTEVPIANFEQALRKMAAKGKLSADSVPMTCDRMRRTNAEANPFRNPVTNAKASVKRWAEKLALAQETRDEEAIQNCETKKAEWDNKLVEAEKHLKAWRATKASA